MKKYKIIKVVINNPLMVVGACQQFGSCKVINNSIYIATVNSLKEIKSELESITNVGMKVSIVRDFIPEVAKWIEDMTVQDAAGQILKNLLSTVKV